MYRGELLPGFYDDCGRGVGSSCVATDELQGDIGAVLAKRLGATRPYVVRDSGVYGQIMAAQFTASAAKIGLQVVGNSDELDSPDDVADAVRRVQQAGADLVYWSGTDDDVSGKLWQMLRSTLGDARKLMGPDGIYSSAFIAAAGRAAEGTYTMTASSANGALPAPATRRLRR